jgi:hypothetical protein
MVVDMSTSLPHSVGLGGDGDEVAAIRDVEEAFGVSLDQADAPGWRTAGDVYASLCRALPPEEAARPGTWDRFASALARETGVDPQAITPDSPLLVPDSRWALVSNASAMLWLVIAALAVVGAVWALVQRP